VELLDQRRSREGTGVTASSLRPDPYKWWCYDGAGNSWGEESFQPHGLGAEAGRNGAGRDDTVRKRRR